MAARQVLPMNEGEGPNSYAKNSILQGDGQRGLQSLVEEAITDICKTSIPNSIGIADLGCASGPNAFSLVTMAIDAIQQLSQSPREICVFLNDLPENDFNTIFKHLPAFLQRHKEEKGEQFGPLLVYGAPGSFYGRLFPVGSLHLVCSSTSLHWLSQVPKELVDKENGLVNKGDVGAGRTSPPAVFDAYARQFKKDFTLFLKARAEEIVPRGRMVIQLAGRPTDDGYNDEGPGSFLADVLNDMACKGIIDEEKLESFNIPVHSPSYEEFRGIIETEGSFEISFLGKIEAGDLCTKSLITPQTMAMMIRAAFEPALVRHFGVEIMDDLMRTSEEHATMLLNQPRMDSRIFLRASLTRK